MSEREAQVIGPEDVAVISVDDVVEERKTSGVEPCADWRKPWHVLVARVDTPDDRRFYSGHDSSGDASALCDDMNAGGDKNVTYTFERRSEESYHGHESKPDFEAREADEAKRRDA